MKKMLGLIFAIAVMVSANSAMAADEGHCKYTRENDHTPQPYKVCEMPADVSLCLELGATNSNSNAVYGDGACPTEDAIGTCDKETSQLVYYDGDPEGVEIGCSFSSGDWVAAE